MAFDPDHQAGSDSTHSYRFDGAEFDEARMRLSVDGRAIDSQPKPLQLLGLLLRRVGAVVSKDEVAAALGERHAARLVTVPRVGYRFDGPIDRIAASDRVVATASAFSAGEPVPGRENYRLDRRLGGGRGGEVWLARGDAAAARELLERARAAGVVDDGHLGPAQLVAAAQQGGRH